MVGPYALADLCLGDVEFCFEALLYLLMIKLDDHERKPQTSCKLGRHALLWPRFLLTIYAVVHDRWALVKENGRYLESEDLPVVGMRCAGLVLDVQVECHDSCDDCCHDTPLRFHSQAPSWYAGC